MYGFFFYLSLQITQGNVQSQNWELNSRNWELNSNAFTKLTDYSR